MKLKLSLIIASLACSLSLSAYNRLPTDPDVRIGKLDNGLTYYIRHNERPQGQADVFLAQSVGSINEEENQRGLAHFLEHMCFNGTRHFPGNSLIDYLESVGVKFGANLNAYTSTDRTVYNICDIPTSRPGTIDSCLLIVRDWSGNLLLNDKDIDEERGVIVGEWRQRQGQPSSRMMEKAVAEIYPGSRYGERMPIGLMSVVENFAPDELRDYYHKWYNPMNQCVVVVGDIDPDKVEHKIRALWADYRPGKEATKSTPVEIADNTTPIVTVQTDPEQGRTMLQLYIKHPATADSLANTIVELREEVYADLVAEMLAERFDEAERIPGAPFSNLGIGNMNFLLASGQPALMIRSNVADGKAVETAKIFASELKLASAQGFTETELTRAKLNARSGADTRFAGVESITNSEYARRYVDNFLDGGPAAAMLPSEEVRYKMIKGVINTTTLDDVNAYLASIVRPDNSNVVFIAYSPEGKAPEAAAIAAAYTAINGAELEPYVDTFAVRPLMASTPAAGKIVGEDTHPVLGNTRLTLGNGIKVNLLPSDYEPGRVYIYAKSPGGLSQNFDPTLRADYLALDNVLGVSRLGENTSVDVRRILAGKDVRSSLNIKKMDEEISSAAATPDLETALQLVYLRATDLRPDSTAFESYLASQRLKAESHSKGAVNAMGDSIHFNVFAHHPLAGEHLSPDDIDKISYDRILGIWRDRYGDMSDFTFYIAGDFDADSIRPLIETYIASLPAAGRIEKPKDIGYRYEKVSEHRRFTGAMETPQTIAYTFFNAPCDYNLRNVVMGNIFGRIVQNRLRRDLREERGWTYSIKGHVGISAGMNGDDPASIIMPVYIRVAPENAQATFDIVAQTVDSLCQPGSITAEELNTCREYLLKNHSEAIRDNNYRISLVRAYDYYGEDMESGYVDFVNSLTPDDISAFAAKYFPNASRLQLEMSPEK